MPEDITKEIIKRAKDATPSILEILSSTVGCNLRRPAATDADLSGRSAEPNGHPC